MRFHTRVIIAALLMLSLAGCSSEPELPAIPSSGPWIDRKAEQARFIGKWQTDDNDYLFTFTPDGKLAVGSPKHKSTKIYNWTVAGDKLTMDITEGKNSLHMVLLFEFLDKDRFTAGTAPEAGYKFYRREFRRVAPAPQPSHH